MKGRPQRKFSFPPEDISITIEVPLQFNLRVNAEDDADIHINNLEGGWIYDITTDRGNCHLSSIKGTDLHVKSNNGNIFSKSNLLAEFGTLAVGNSGVISVGKLQGRKFCLDAESGAVSTGPLYLQRGEVNTQTGSVTLGDVHGKIMRKEYKRKEYLIVKTEMKERKEERKEEKKGERKKIKKARKSYSLSYA